MKNKGEKMKNPWDELPNAAHIDRILAHLKANPEKWDAMLPSWVDFVGPLPTGQKERIRRDAAAWVEAWEKAYDEASEAVWAEVRETAWAVEARESARSAAWSALLALVVWDDCAHYLDLTPEQIKIFALLGHQAAILLQPAVRAMEVN